MFVAQSKNKAGDGDAEEGSQKGSEESLAARGGTGDSMKELTVEGIVALEGCGDGLLDSSAAQQHEPDAIRSQFGPRIISVEDVVGEGVVRKNIIMDYRTLRKSGYFLEKPLKREVPHQSSNDKATEVYHWVNSSPDNPSIFGDPVVNLTGLSRSQLLDRFATEEERLKRLVLGEKSKLGWTSEPAPTLTLQQLDDILEVANEQVDRFLEDSRKTEGFREYEYVCGTVAFPDSWRTKSSDKICGSGTGLYHWMKSWFSTGAPKNEMNPKSDHLVREGRGEPEIQLILEPYHGPTFINGAVIKAGATLNEATPDGITISGRVVQEVKAFLKAIHRALYRNKQVQSNPPAKASPTAKPQPPSEDPEIQKLTELLQKKAQGQKNATLKKTVFVLQNPDNPDTQIARRRVARLPPLPVRARRGIFSRAVNGMIRRNPAPNAAARRSRQRVGDARPIPFLRTNRVNPGNRNFPSPHPNSAAVVAGLVNVVRLITPFHIPTPVPATPYYSLPVSENYARIQVPQQQIRLGGSSRMSPRTNQPVLRK